MRAARTSAVVLALALAGCATARPPPPAPFWSPGRLLPPIGVGSAPEAKAEALADADPPLAVAVGPGGRALAVSAVSRDGLIVHPLAGYELDGQLAFAAVTILLPGSSRDTPFAATTEGAVIAAAPLPLALTGDTPLALPGPSIALVGFEGGVRWTLPLPSGLCGLTGDRSGGFWLLADGRAERRSAADGRLLASVELGRCGRLAASDEGDAVLVWDEREATLAGAGGTIHRAVLAPAGASFASAEVGGTLAVLRLSDGRGALALPRGGGRALLVSAGAPNAVAAERAVRVELPAGERVGVALEVQGRLVVASADHLRAWGPDGTEERSLALGCPGGGAKGRGCHAIGAAATPGGPAWLVLVRLTEGSSAGAPPDLGGAWLVALDPRALTVRWRATLPASVPAGVGRAMLSGLRGPWRHEDAVLAWRTDGGLGWWRP